ncbi:hypothetical protein AAGR22_19110 [Erwinia sp. HDF1-3R]|uniref:hypothetical protein n=1 Tax=Erwinia sp. HDF1-3R TaxID=3141543 RepID=UPI0031F569E3
MNISSIATIIIAFITVAGAMVSTTVFQQMIAFAGGCFAVLVVIALTVGSAVQKLKPLTDVQPVADDVKNDAQIISEVKSMRFAGYDDATIALSLKIDSAVVEAIPK